jgi:hypothetical protein
MLITVSVSMDTPLFNFVNAIFIVQY